MHLKAYLAQKNISITEFSKYIECSRCYLSSVVCGQRLPSKRLARDIEKVTDGFVTMQDLKDRYSLRQINKLKEIDESIKEKEKIKKT